MLQNKTLSFQSEFVHQLSDILGDLSAPDFVRQQAGLQIKNSLVAKDDDLKVQYNKNLSIQ